MQPEPRNILLATDGSPASAGARAAAAHLCRHGDAALHVVYAVPPWDSQSAADPARSWMIAHAERRRIEGELGCPVAGLHVPHGFRVPAVLGTAGATHADLVVVGGRQLGVIGRLMSYRVSRGVMVSAHVPVLMVPDGGSEWPPRHVVVGCDGSPESLRAADVASWIAQASDADLLVTSVAGAGALASAREARRVAVACADAIRARGVVHSVIPHVVQSVDAAEALRGLCDRMSGRVLVAVGARRHRTVDEPGGSSVSGSLGDAGHLPMLLVPARPPVERVARPTAALASRR